MSITNYITVTWFDIILSALMYSGRMGFMNMNIDCIKKIHVKYNTLSIPDCPRVSELPKYSITLIFVLDM